MERGKMKPTREVNFIAHSAVPVIRSLIGLRILRASVVMQHGYLGASKR